jgi:protein-disulfide isomerase-like protein with CxxC motif
VEIVILEDPACHWCWAFQPIETTLLFEYGEHLTPRRVMAGLRDRPLPETGIVRQQWQSAAEVSGMPFLATRLGGRVLSTTYAACRAVKAISSSDPEFADRYLRRIREAYFVEGISIDDTSNLVALAIEIGAPTDGLQSGRGHSLFEEDRRRASGIGFGLPTLTLRPSGAAPESTKLLQGLVPYEELVETLASVGLREDRRRRFHGSARDWERLFAVRERITLPEIRHLSGWDDGDILRRLSQIGAIDESPFFRLEEQDCGAACDLTSVEALEVRDEEPVAI